MLQWATTVPLEFPTIWNAVISHCKKSLLTLRPVRDALVHIHRGTVSWLTAFLWVSACASPQSSSHSSGACFSSSPLFPNQTIVKMSHNPGYIFQFIIPAPHSSFLTSVKWSSIKVTFVRLSVPGCIFSIHILMSVFFLCFKMTSNNQGNRGIFYFLQTEMVYEVWLAGSWIWRTKGCFTKNEIVINSPFMSFQTSVEHLSMLIDKRFQFPLTSIVFCLYKVNGNQTVFRISAFVFHTSVK